MNAKPIAALSLLVNIGLGIALAVQMRKPAPAVVPEPVAVSQPAETKVARPAPETEVVTNILVQKVAQKFGWRLVESPDYKKYIANLRAIGCPEETIRDIIIADVNKLFESRRKELTTSTNKFEYWKGGNPFAGAMDPERIEKAQALNKEKRALLKELLGIEPEEKPNMFASFNPFESMLDFLPSEKQSQVMDIYMKYQAKMAKTFGGGGQPDAEDMKAMKKAQADMDKEMAALMSPEDYRQYQLRMSQTAMAMRMQLGSFDANQQEFDKIFNLRKGFDDKYGGMFGLDNRETQEEKEERKAAQKAMNDQLKATLGDARYAEYERAQDWNYQNLYRITDKYGLPKETANKVYDIKKEAEKTANNIQNDSSLSPEDKTAALARIRHETEKAIGPVMGQKGWDSYKKQAYWLNQISRKPE